MLAGFLWKAGKKNKGEYKMKEKLIMDKTYSSLYTFLNLPETQEDELINQGVADGDMIYEILNLLYGEEYFCLVDYNNDNCGSFRVRVFKT